MTTFLLWAVPVGAIAAVLTTLYLSKDHCEYPDDRTSGERKFFTGRWE